MIDGIIKADGTSRLMKSELPATYEEFRAQCHAGTQPLDVLFNALGWSQMPTFLNKANLLKDTTAALFGLSTDAVPDSVFDWLGQYNAHWWSVLHGQASVAYKESKTAFTMTNGDIHWIVRDTVATTLTYSSAVSVDSATGAVSFLNPKTISLTAWYGTDTELRAAKTQILGKYVKGFDFDPDTLYYVPTSASITITRATYYCMYMANTTIYKVGSEAYNIPAGATTYEHSTDRNAYPDSGTVDGLTYEYLGIPFQNAVTAPQIASGSYTGTGTYGASKPNSLTFDFAPKFLVVAKNGKQTGYSSGGSFYWVYPSTGSVNITKANDSYTPSVSVSGNTVSWYVDAAATQLNVSGTTYHYFAIG